MADKDNNLDRIIDQQAHIKMIIERDCRIRYLKKSICDNNNAIECLRKSCAKIGLDNHKEKQEQLRVQSTEVSSYRLLFRSIYLVWVALITIC